MIMSGRMKIFGIEVIVIKGGVVYAKNNQFFVV